MATIAQFGELKFEITSGGALLFENLKLSVECDTDDKTKKSQTYVFKKSGKPVEISFTILLNAALGIDVEKSVAYILYAAQGNVQERFYIGQQCIFPFLLMMVQADVEEIKISPTGSWTSAKVSVTLKQCTEETMAKTQWEPYGSIKEDTDSAAAIQSVVRTTKAAKARKSTIAKISPSAAAKRVK